MPGREVFGLGIIITVKLFEILLRGIIGDVRKDASSPFEDSDDLVVFGDPMKRSLIRYSPRRAAVSWRTLNQPPNFFYSLAI